MPLSQEEKEALADHFKNSDLYDPSKVKEQETSDFSPKCMCGGGHVMGMCHGGETKGYEGGGDVAASAPPRDFDLSKKHAILGMARGGNVPGIDLGNQGGFGNLGSFGPSDFSGPDISADTDTIKNQGLKDALVPVFDQEVFNKANATSAPAPKEIPLPTPTSTFGPGGPLRETGNPVDKTMSALGLSESAAAPASSAPVEPLAPDQMDELIAALSQKQSLGQSAMSGLAGLADAISSGVARAGSPGFQKNIMESQQTQKQNLIKALETKYGRNVKQQELEETKRAHNLEDSAKKAERDVQVSKEQGDASRAAATLKFQQDKEDIQARLESGKITQEQANKELEMRQKGSGMINALERKLGFGPPLPPDTASAGPLGATTVKNGKNYQWSPSTQKYHLVQ